MRERVIEGYLREEVKKIGGMCVKMEPRYNVGIPDRLLIYQKLMLFVEVKAPGQKPTDRQLQYHRRLSDQGITVVMVDTRDAVDALIRAVVSTIEKENAKAK